MARVVVDGVGSDLMEIANAVFQGTVLGPPLWNTFFGNVLTPAKSLEAVSDLFADDLNAFWKLDRLAENGEVT